MYTPAMFVARFPEFTGILTGSVQPIIDEAVLMIDENRWGDLYNTGIGYYVAHHMAVAKIQATGDAGASLPATMMKAGSLTMQYHSLEESRAGEAFYQSTSYGQKLLELKKIIGLGAFVV